MPKNGGVLVVPRSHGTRSGRCHGPAYVSSHPLSPCFMTFRITRCRSLEYSYPCSVSVPTASRARARAHGHTECRRVRPTRTFTHLLERGRPRPRAGLGVYVRFEGLTRMFKGLRANDTPRQTPLCPKRRPPRPQPPVFSTFLRGGLHFGHHTASHRGLTVTKRGELHYMRLRHAGDTPAASS